MDRVDVLGAPHVEGGVAEMAMKAVLIPEGQETRHVGFLPRHVATRPEEVQWLHDRFARVIELYDDLALFMYQRTKSTHNNGMALFVLLNNAPELENN